MPWYVVLMAIAFVLVCVFMILVILIQRPRGGGLAGAFGGGGGSSEAAFGAKTGDVLTWFTVACFVLFLALAMGLTWTIKPVQTSTPSNVPSGTAPVSGAPPAETTDPGGEAEAVGADDLADDGAERGSVEDLTSYSEDTDPTTEP